MNSTRTDFTPDHIYYDVLIPYNSTAGNATLASYGTTFTSTFIEHPENYYMAIDRIYCPATTIPIFAFQPNTYKIELEYNSVSSGIFYVQWLNADLTTTAPKPPNGYNVYDFDIFLLMINRTISSAFTALGAMVTLPTGSQAPFFYIDKNTYFLKLQATQAGFDNTTLTAMVINMFMNIPMIQFVNGISNSFQFTPTIANRNISFNFWNTGNNLVTIAGVPYLIMSTQYGIKTIQAWNQSKGLLLTTSSIPVGANEYLPSIDQFNQSYSTSSLTGAKILSNFDFIYDGSDTRPLLVQYFTSSPYKKIDLLSVLFNRFDIQVYWYDSFNNIHPIYLNVGEGISIRFVFIKKNNCID